MSKYLGGLFIQETEKIKINFFVTLIRQYFAQISIFFSFPPAQVLIFLTYFQIYILLSN